MYIKNMSGNYQVFRAAGAKFKVAPGEVVSITDEQADDCAVSLLLSKGAFEKVGKKEAVAEMKAAAEKAEEKAEERKMEVKRVDEASTPQVIMAQCSGVKKDGERCGNNVPVQAAEYDKDAKYYCRLHIKQAEKASKPEKKASDIVTAEEA